MKYYIFAAFFAAVAILNPDLNEIVGSWGNGFGPGFVGAASEAISWLTSSI